MMVDSASLSLMSKNHIGRQVPGALTPQIPRSGFSSTLSPGGVCVTVNLDIRRGSIRIQGARASNGGGAAAHSLLMHGLPLSLL